MPYRAALLYEKELTKEYERRAPLCGSTAGGPRPACSPRCTAHSRPESLHYGCIHRLRHDRGGPSGGSDTREQLLRGSATLRSGLSAAKAEQLASGTRAPRLLDERRGKTGESELPKPKGRWAREDFLSLRWRVRQALCRPAQDRRIHGRPAVAGTVYALPALSARQRLPGQTRQAASVGVEAGRTHPLTRTSRQARCGGAGPGAKPWTVRSVLTPHAGRSRRGLGAERGNDHENDAFPNRNRAPAASGRAQRSAVRDSKRKPSRIVAPFTPPPGA
jgi:hypothetical protein